MNAEIQQIYAEPDIVTGDVYKRQHLDSELTRPKVFLHHQLEMLNMI